MDSRRRHDHAHHHVQRLTRSTGHIRPNATPTGATGGQYGRNEARRCGDHPPWTRSHLRPPDGCGSLMLLSLTRGNLGQPELVAGGEVGVVLETTLELRYAVGPAAELIGSGGESDAPTPVQLPVRPVYLDHLDALAAQVPGQGTSARPVGARPRQGPGRQISNRARSQSHPGSDPAPRPWTPPS